MFFFDEIEVFLQESLDSKRGESYIKEMTIGYINIDFFIPNGCARWNYPPNTIIKVIDSLKAGSIYHARRDITNLWEEGYEIKAYYIFCNEIPNPEYLPLKSSNNHKDIIHVVDFNNLRGIKKPMFENDNYWKDRQTRIKTKAKSDFSVGKNTLFLGAGLSKSCGLPSWDELLDTLLTSLRKNKSLSINDLEACKNDSQGSLLVKARYLKQFYNEAKRSFTSDIREILYRTNNNKRQLLNTVVSLIKTGNIETVISYNYDDLLEEALLQEKIKFTPIDRSNRPTLGTLPILHTHGFIPREGDADYERNVVLSEEDYHSLYQDTYHWANIEQLHALTQTTCYFIGLSLKDPSLRRLLDIAQKRGSGNAVHYAFLPRFEYIQPTKAEAIFYNMGVNVIWYEDVNNELPLLVENLADYTHTDN